MTEDEWTIPACLDLRNADVAAKREEGRAQPLTSIPIQDTRKPRNLDAEAQAFMEAEAERERIKKENAFTKFKNRTATKAITIQGGRFDSRRNKWITPEQDFAEMSMKARTWDGEPMTIDELRAAFEDVAAMPDMPLKPHNKGGKAGETDPNKECCRAFARRILKGLDNAKLAIEGEKAMERAKRALKKAEQGTMAVAPSRRRAA